MNHFAYLDPGTGSIVLQAIVGVLLGLIVILRTRYKAIVSKFSKKQKNPIEDIDE